MATICDVESEWGDHCDREDEHPEPWHRQSTLGRYAAWGYRRLAFKQQYEPMTSAKKQRRG